jgi:hypothetical protein
MDNPAVVPGLMRGQMRLFFQNYHPGSRGLFHQSHSGRGSDNATTNYCNIITFHIIKTLTEHFEKR